MSYSNESVARDSWQQSVEDFVANVEITDEQNVSFDDVAGMHDVKHKLTEWIVSPVKTPEQCQGGKCQRILMYGLPGVGKSLLLRAMLSELFKENAKCYLVSVYNFISRCNKAYASMLMEAMFSKLKESSPSVLVIEDIEVLCDISNEKLQELKNSFNLCINLAQTDSKYSGIQIVIGVSNKPWKLKSDVLRQFDLHLYIPLPDSKARCDILKSNIKSLNTDITEQQISSLDDMMKGLTGADISVAVRDASMIPIRRLQYATHFKQVTGVSEENPDEVVDGLFTPCNPDEIGSIKMNWTDIPTGKLCAQKISMEDIRKSLSDTKSSVSDEDLQLVKTFQETYTVD